MASSSKSGQSGASLPRGATAAPDIIERPAGVRQRTFASLRHRDFLLLWTGSGFMNAGQWLQQVTLGWMVFEMTGSAFLLGLINAVRLTPFIFTSLISGVMADRSDRRRLMLAAQVYLMAVTLVMTLVLLLGRIELWHLFAFTFISGIGWSFTMTVRQSFVPSLVPREDLTNAMALVSAANNATRLIGPAAGGFLIAALGVAGNFLVQTVLYGVVVLTITALQYRPLPESGPLRKAPPMWTSMLDGFKYVRGNREVWVLLVLALVPMTLLLPYISLLPIYAGRVFDIGPGGLGVLLAVAGLGSLMANLFVASAREMRRKGLIQLVALGVTGLTLVFFSRATWLPLALVLLVVMGAAQMTYFTINQTVLQIATREDMRGRVMSLYMLNAGLIPLGSFVAGTLAAFIGAPMTLTIMGAAAAGMAALAAVRFKDLREA
jgi:MFS family permease